jgi:3-methyladenine DNA glycosylase AlkD
MHQFIQVCRNKLRNSRDAQTAAEMQRYMKSEQPFYGVKTPLRKKIFREAMAACPITSRADYEAIIAALWAGQYREELYQALEVAQNCRAFHGPESWLLYEKLVFTAPHWDTLDWLATRVVSPLILQDRRLEAKLIAWSESDSFWVRRASLLAHLKHKGETNRELLAKTIIKLADEDEFFIRKAIGWVLREYSCTDPQWVYDFVSQHNDELSALSRREALKHLNRKLSNS